MEQLGSQEHLQQLDSPNKPSSKKSLDSPHKIISLESQESLVVNRGFEGFANPEDFMASISTIRSIHESDSISLQKICSSAFLRRTDPLPPPTQKSYAEYFPYIIKEDPHNEQTDSMGPSAQASNLRSSGTSVAQQIKVHDEELLATSEKDYPSHRKHPSSSGSVENSKKPASEISGFSYRFDRKIESSNGANDKLR